MSVGTLFAWGIWHTSEGQGTVAFTEGLDTLKLPQRGPIDSMYRKAPCHTPVLLAYTLHMPLSYTCL